MIIKKSSLDTMLCMFIMLTLVSPYFNANINKILVSVSMFFLLIRILFGNVFITLKSNKVKF